MRKNQVLLALFFTVFALLSNAKTYIVKNEYYSFSPKNLTVDIGDTVKFEISITHNAVEVSKETYDKKGSASNGGFNVPYGGGMAHFTKAGDYYYVCEPHAEMGMIGLITVRGVTTSVNSNEALKHTLLAVYPNPALGYVNVKSNISVTSDVNLKFIDMSGRLIQNEIEKTVGPGEYIRVFTFEKTIKPGKYFLLLQSNEGLSSQIVIVR